ncbi:unnamed protein product [Leuciscus chuanchicus]
MGIMTKDDPAAVDHVTISCVKPVLNLFSNNILQAKENDIDLTKAIKKSVLDNINSKYGETVTEELINLATLLEPCFRTEHMSESESKAIQARAAREVESLLSAHSAASEPSLETAEDTQLTQGVSKRPKKTLRSFFKGAATEKTDVSEREKIIAELHSYLNCPPADSECDPLMWWKTHEVNFPRISRLAKKYLCIPATSAASERLFSTGGNVVTLKPTSVIMLVFLTKNLKL